MCQFNEAIRVISDIVSGPSGVFFFWWGAGKSSVGLWGQWEDRGVGLHRVFVQAQGMSSCRKKMKKEE